MFTYCRLIICGFSVNEMKYYFLCEWLKLICKWQFISCFSSHFAVSLLCAVQKVWEKKCDHYLLTTWKMQRSLKIGHHHFCCHFSYPVLSQYPQHPSSETWFLNLQINIPCMVFWQFWWTRLLKDRGRFPYK
jgi:hypothetical protein